MSKIAILALASAASALATAAAAVAEEFGGDTSGSESTGAETPGKRRGRPPADSKEKDEPKGRSYEELQAIIKPLVEDSKGDEVKKVIAKHANGGNLKALVELPQNHAAFEKDIAALAF